MENYSLFKRFFGIKWMGLVGIEQGKGHFVILDVCSVIPNHEHNLSLTLGQQNWVQSSLFLNIQHGAYSNHIITFRICFVLYGLFGRTMNVFS